MIIEIGLLVLAAVSAFYFGFMMCAIFNVAKQCDADPESLEKWQLLSGKLSLQNKIMKNCLERLRHKYALGHGTHRTVSEALNIVNKLDGADKKGGKQ